MIFQGVTREVERLEYEAYVEMAEVQIERILRECIEAHGLLGAAAEHRVGDVALGQPSVVVAVSAAHRAEAFAGARAAIDRIKAEAPIWKREHPLERRGSLGMSEQRMTHLDEERTRAHGRRRSQAARRACRPRTRARAHVACERARGGAGRGAKGRGALGGAFGRHSGGQADRAVDPAGSSARAHLRGRVGHGRPERGLVELTSEVRTISRTGVEMEALTACAVAALTVYDMVKALQRDVEIEQVVLLEKRGGRSDYVRAGEDAADARPEHVHTRGGRGRARLRGEQAAPHGCAHHDQQLQGPWRRQR